MDSDNIQDLESESEKYPEVRVERVDSDIILKNEEKLSLSKSERKLKKVGKS
jgi:hypothetical protein